jgi:hypothetical protein
MCAAQPDLIKVQSRCDSPIQFLASTKFLKADSGPPKPRNVPSEQNAPIRWLAFMDAIGLPNSSDNAID